MKMLKRIYQSSVLVILDWPEARQACTKRPVGVKLQGLVEIQASQNGMYRFGQGPEAALPAAGTYANLSVRRDLR